MNRLWWNFIMLLGGVVKDLAPRRSQDYVDWKLEIMIPRQRQLRKAGKFYQCLSKTAKLTDYRWLMYKRIIDIILKKWIKNK
jgi:hypothetical protein